MGFEVGVGDGMIGFEGNLGVVEKIGGDGRFPLGKHGY